MRAQDQQPPELLKELAPQQWALWKQSPVSQLVFARYLPDFRFELERATMQTWMAGALTLQQEQESRGRLLMLHELENISLPRVQIFYGLQQDEEDAPPRRRPGAQGYE